MGFAKLALYLAGLGVIVLAAWIFLTQTPLRNSISPGVGLAIILLLVGIGVMASARAMDDTFSYRKRVVRDDAGPSRDAFAPSETTNNQTVVEERRY